MNHPFNAALAETARHKNAVVSLEFALESSFLQALGLDPMDIDFDVVSDAAMQQRFLQALVRILVLDIFADQRDIAPRRAGSACGASMADQRSRLRGPSGSRLQMPQDDLIDSLFGEDQRDFVDRIYVFGGDDRFRIHVAEERNLVLHVGRQKALGAAKKNIGLNTDGAQFFDAVLRGLGFQFLRGGDPRNERDMNENAVLAADLMAHLPDSFEKGQRFDIADGAADLDRSRHRHRAASFADSGLDLVRDVRDHLDRLAEIIAAALALDDLLVDAATREIVGAGQMGMGEPFVMTEIEIRFGAVVGDEYLPVLERAHGARDPHSGRDRTSAG